MKFTMERPAAEAQSVETGAKRPVESGKGPVETGKRPVEIGKRTVEMGKSVPVPAEAGRRIEKSHVVRSEAGRDRGRLFLVLAEEGEYLLLADGKGRKLESPKRKKRRHVSFVSARETRVSRKILEGEKLSNSELRRTLAAFRQADDQEG